MIFFMFQMRSRSQEQIFSRRRTQAVGVWAFLWGPIGAFLSVPFLIVGLAIRDHIAPDENPDLPA